MKRRQVEFVAFTHIPELGGWTAILQERNDFNSESASGYKRQSYAGAYQLTFCEKAEGDEEVDALLMRGATDELGTLAAHTLMTSEKHGPLYAGKTELEDKIVLVYVARVPSTILKEIRNEVAGRSKLIPVSSIYLIQPLDREKDKGGVTPGTIKMFPDAVDNLQYAYAWLRTVESIT